MKTSRKKFIVIALALAGIMLLLSSMMRGRRQPEAVVPAIQSSYDRLILQANLLTSELEPGSEIVALVFAEEFEHGAQPHYQRAFRSLKKMGIRVTEVEQLVVKPGKEAPMLTFGFPVSDYLRVAEAYPEAEAILSFCGLPYGSVEPQQEDLSHLPQLLLARVDHGTPALRSMLVNGLVTAVAIPADWTPELQSMIDDGLVAAGTLPGKDREEGMFVVHRRP